MNVIQSYFTTIMHGNFSVYEIRIFIKIVEQANQVLGKGTKYSSLIGRAICTDGINCNLSIPIKAVMTPNSHDYEAVKDSLKKLTSKKIEFYNVDKKTWCYTPFISNVRVADGDGLIRFTVARWLLDYIMDFINCNYTQYNLAAALSLPSAYAVRLYWLTCNMDHEITWSVEMLRDILGVGDKYKQTKDFIKRCIEPAETLLRDKKMNGFTYTRVFNHGKVTGLCFHPVRREQENTAQLTAQASLSAWCDPALRMYLTQQVGFSIRELSSHKDTLFKFGHISGWENLLLKIVNRARKKRAGKGYYIQAIRKEVEAAALDGGLRKDPGSASGPASDNTSALRH